VVLYGYNCIATKIQSTACTRANKIIIWLGRRAVLAHDTKHLSNPTQPLLPFSFHLVPSNAPILIVSLLCSIWFRKHTVNLTCSIVTETSARSPTRIDISREETYERRVDDTFV